jgi:hypothetical protein
MLRRAGPVNLAAALRHHARDPARPRPPWASSSSAGTHERTLRENARTCLDPFIDHLSGKSREIRAGVSWMTVDILPPLSIG